MDVIRELCRRYTDLNEEEIAEIKNAARYLSHLASMFNADAFIDCQIRNGNGDAIVVAEAKPIDGISSYKNKVVGLVAYKEKEPAVYRTFHLSVPTKFMKAVTQENTHVVQTVDPIMFKDRVIGVFIVEQRIEKVTSREMLNRNSVEYKGDGQYDGLLMESGYSNEFVDTIEEGILFIDSADRIAFRNKAAADLYNKLGFVEDILGKSYMEIALTKESWNLQTNETTIQEVKIGDYYLNVKTVKVMRDDIKFIVALTDITDAKIKERELILKSVAFKEMHHRVKNNMQTIAGLLRLQRNKSASPEVKKALTDTISRILAISSTHELLLETDMEEVKLIEILTNLKDNSLLYYGNDNFDLEIETFGGDFDIKFEKAVSIALVINELIQNSIKHAFVGRKKGKITILAQITGHNSVKIAYIDDGIGFDEKLTKSNTLGWSIVNLMIKETLKGYWSFTSGPEGTKVRFEFDN